MTDQMEWRSFLENITPDVSFNSPALPEEIEKAESNLDVLFPDELKNLLQDSNGVNGSFGLGLIWNTDRISKDNLFFRSFPEYQDIYMPFCSLLFFADAGNGDNFAFAILNGEIRKPDVYVWNHEDDSRKWVAPSLNVYLDWWLTGKLKI